MTFEVTHIQNQARVRVTILQPHGELDGSNFQDLIAAARQAYAAGARDMLLDLSDVSYISSAGLVALQSIAALLRGDQPPDPESGWPAFRAIDRDRDRGIQAHFKLVNPQPAVDHILELVGFKHFLEIHADLSTAASSF
jgi:anti-anti-sigma regulatory factor